MRAELDLGRIGGFRVAVSWSTALLLVLLTWALAEGQLPLTAPGHPAAVYYAAGVVGAALLVGSLLAHELAHALVARRWGVEVEKLTLWVFGGIATLRGEPPSPKADFRIAVVGPATSMVLAAGFAGARYVLDGLGADDLTLAVTGWLAVANAVLGVFNLLPGAPFDGGRVLRAALWWRRHDRDSAAITATAAGLAMAWSLIVLGVLAIVVGDLVGGLWLGLIGWFVMNAAGTERASIVAEQALRDVRVGDVMSPDVRTGAGDLTVEEFIARYLIGGRHSAHPVVDSSGEVIGLMTLSRLREVPPAQRARTLVRDVCLPLAAVARCTPDEPLAAVLGRVTAESGRRALVFDQLSDRPGRLVGILTPADVVRSVEARALVSSWGQAAVPSYDARPLVLRP